MALDGRLDMRCDAAELEDFKSKCKQLGREHQPMLREMIKAFNEARLRIIPTDEEKKIMKEIHNVN